MLALRFSRRLLWILQSSALQRRLVLREPGFSEAICSSETSGCLRSAQRYSLESHTHALQYRMKPWLPEKTDWSSRLWTQIYKFILYILKFMNRTAAVGSRRLTSWAIALAVIHKIFHFYLKDTEFGTRQVWIYLGTCFHIVQTRSGAHSASCLVGIGAWN
jgi:hypothetical protein